MFRQRQEFKVYPIDTKPNTAIGIKFPFNKTKPFSLNYTTQDQIKSNLMVFMLTNKGERVFNPEFGADIRGHLFESTISLGELKESISDKILLYFPEITILDLVFTADDDTNTFYITLTYSFNKISDKIIIQIDK